MTLEDIKRIALSNGKETCFFNIQEHTKNEYVAVGSNGNILRWKATGGNEQKWVLLPVGTEGNFNIITLQNGENMAVGSNGNILRWASTGNKDQRFTFLNYNEQNKTYNIQEHTKDEYVSVGSDGNILRWKKTNENSQLFTLVPINVIGYPDETKIKSILNGETVYKSEEEIPAPPVCDYLKDSPSETPHYIIEGVEVLPSVLVSDSRYSNVIDQINAHPYYYLVRRRYWKNIYDKILLPDMTESMQATVSFGCSRTDIKQIEISVGVVVGASVSGEGGSKKAKISGKLSAQYSWTKTELSRQEQTTEETITQTETSSLSIKQEARIIAWQAIDNYILYDAKNNVVNNWTMYDNDHKIIWQSGSKTNG
ncbi:MAG: hypothetical protein H6Q17_2352 [Bacteroidetes bacterium]|nr:hypothetical protein [Bacteroidota bacterium]